MRLAGGVGESAGHQQHIGLQRAVQLGKAQVVAHAHADGVHMAVARGQFKAHRLGAGFEHAGFVVLLLALIEAKQVNLVVARHASARGRVGQRTVARPARVQRGHRQRAANNPDAEPTRPVAQEILHCAAPSRLLEPELVAVFQAHHAKVLGQHGQLGALSCGLLEQHGSGVKIGLQRQARDHLDGSYFHEKFSI